MADTEKIIAMTRSELVELVRQILAEIPDVTGYAKKTDIPSSLPANGGDADTINNHTVDSDVPANAVFTDTTNSDVTAEGNTIQMDGLQGGVPFSEIAVSGDDIVGHDLTVNVSGKNLLKYPYVQTTRASYGITFTDNGDGSITASGTHDGGNDSAFFGFSPWWTDIKKYGRIFLPKGKTITFKIKGLPNTYKCEIFVMKDSTSSDAITAASAAGETVAKYTAKQDCYIACGIYGAKSSVGQTVNFTAYPQLELGDTATDYEPYHGAEYTITPDTNPYVIPNDIRQREGLNVVSVSEGTLSVTGVRKNAAIEKIYTDLKTVAFSGSYIDLSDRPTTATTETDGLMSAEDKDKLDAFEITTTGGKLHDKDIATTDLIPTTLPANGGNADSADTLTDWGTRIVTDANDAPFGFCAALDCENAPNTFWSTILTTGSSGATSYKTQIAFPWAFGVGENRIRYRCENNGEWGSWQEISTTPIKSTTFSGTTDANGNLMLWAASENKIPICTILTEYHSLIFYYAPDGNYYLGVSDFATRAYSPNVSVSGTVYYIEQG